MRSIGWMLLLLPHCTLVQLDDLNAASSGDGGAVTSSTSTTVASGPTSQANTANASVTAATVASTISVAQSGSASTSGLNCGGKLACGGVCVDELSDPEHCGRCDHNCQAGECLLGECQPVVMWEGMSGYATGVDVTDTEVVWSATGGVRALSKFAAPGTVPRIVSTLSGARVLATPTSVYISGPSVTKVDIVTGVKQATFTPPLSCKHDLQVDASHLYCSGIGVYRFNLDTTGMVELQTGLVSGWHSVLADSFHVYWVDSSNRLKRRPLDLSQPAADYQLTGVLGAVRIHNRTLYALAGGLWSVDLDTNVATMMDPTLTAGGMLVADDKDVFVTQWDGQVIRFSLADGKRVVYTQTSDADVIAMDDQYVFFTTYAERTLYRLVR